MGESSSFQLSQTRARMQDNNILTELVKIIITFCIIIMGYVNILKELINIFKYLHFEL